MGLNAMEGQSKSQLMFERLNNSNYRVWAFRMKMILIKEDLWEMIDPGSKKKEDETKGLKALSNIALMVENDQLVHIADSKDGKDASIGHTLRQAVQVRIANWWCTDAHSRHACDCSKY